MKLRGNMAQEPSVITQQSNAGRDLWSNAPPKRPQLCPGESPRPGPVLHTSKNRLTMNVRAAASRPDQPEVLRPLSK